MKSTDMNFLKLYLTERDLGEKGAQSSNHIDEIMTNFYIHRLKKNATKGFLNWVEKHNREVLKPQIKGVDNELGVIDNQFEALDHQYKVDAPQKCKNKEYHKKRRNLEVKRVHKAENLR